MKVSRNRRRAATALAAACAIVITLPGCSGMCAKEAEEAAADERDERTGGEPTAKAPVLPEDIPQVLEEIPADSPYVYAMLEPLPRDVWAGFEGFAPLFEFAFAEARADIADAEPDSDEEADALRIATAVLDEFEGRLSLEGLAELGLSADTRIAFYGLGLMPVFRAELPDPDALAATMARIEERSGVELPSRTLGDRDYWHFEASEGPSVAVAIWDGELFATLGPEPALEQALEILAGDRPLDDTLSVAEFVEFGQERGLSDFGYGYLDTRRLAALLAGGGDGRLAEISSAFLEGEEETDDACAAGLDAALASLPRLTFGYTEVGEDRWSMVLGVETSAELAKMLGELPVSVPGVRRDMGDEAVFAFGAALSLDAGKRVLEHVGGELGAVARACDDDELVADARALSEAASQPIPAPFHALRGGAAVAERFDPDDPADFEGFAIVGADDAASFLQFARMFVPELAALDVEPGGEFRKLPAAAVADIPYDGPISIALGDDVIAVAAGEAGERLAVRAMGAEPEASPLFVVSYDFGAIVDMIVAQTTTAMPPEEEMFVELMGSLGGAFGPVSYIVEPDERGLRFDMSISLR